MLASPRAQYTFRADILFILGSSAVFLLLFAIGRTLLLAYNRQLIGDAAAFDLARAYLIGMRFDLIMTSYVMAPLVIAMFFPSGLYRRGAWRFWFGIWLFVYSFLLVAEPNFYREFHTRLNSLAFQYLREDPATVLSMLWYGFPVVRLLLLCAALTIGSIVLVRLVDRRTRILETAPPSYNKRLGIALVMVLVTVAVARGTFRSGPPLRWGDAYRSDSLFANHLGLNGAFTLGKAAQQVLGETRKNPWLESMPEDQALALVRERWVAPHETLLAPAELPLLRRADPAADAPPSPYKNVVVILMESFSAQRAGVFGNPLQITPNFDALSREGLLFDHIFSNGTHTHQGMFATFGCFPNLPHYEYLMQQPEGAHHFSGLAKVLSQRDYADVFVYNGDFAWDNQSGFFGAQGVRHFVGRHDFINPRFSDPTWGVSDEDMFDRAVVEIAKLQQAGQPYFAMLQTLSNHMPYAVPEPLPVEKVMVDGAEDKHLTAMRYADYALGQFFKQIKARGGFDDTLFVLIGDHAWGGSVQLTAMDLVRFHVPMLFLGKDIQTRFGERRSVVGTQLDMVPTLMGLLGGSYTHHCWGRDLLALPADDPGIAVIKPSGSEQIVAVIEGEYILIEDAQSHRRYKADEDTDGDGQPDAPLRLQRFDLKTLQEQSVDDPARALRLQQLLEAYVQTALHALLDNRSGHGDELNHPRPK